MRRPSLLVLCSGPAPRAAAPATSWLRRCLGALACCCSNPPLRRSRPSLSSESETFGSSSRIPAAIVKKESAQKSRSRPRPTRQTRMRQRRRVSRLRRCRVRPDPRDRRRVRPDPQARQARRLKDQVQAAADAGWTIRPPSKVGVAESGHLSDKPNLQPASGSLRSAGCATLETAPDGPLVLRAGPATTQGHPKLGNGRLS